MSLLDNINEQKVDITKLVKPESPFLSLNETNMYFMFQFNVDGNCSYCMLMIRGLLLNLIDVLSCSTQVKRISVGDIRVPGKWVCEAARIFYDRDMFKSPISMPFDDWLFEIYLDVEDEFTIPEVLRIMCPLCQLLRISRNRNYVYLKSAKIFRTNCETTGNYEFTQYVEYLSYIKSRFSGIDDSKLTGVVNYISKLLEIFNIKIEHEKSDFYNNQLSNYLGHLKS